MSTKFTKQDAYKFAVELAKANVSSTPEWVEPEKIFDFIGEMNHLLICGKETNNSQE